MKRTKLYYVFSLAVSTALNAACLYLGVIKNIVGFMNLFSFVTWAVFITFLISALMTQTDEEKAKFYLGQKDSPVRVLSYYVESAIVLFLAYHGLFLLATLTGLVGVFVYTKFDSGRDAFSRLQASTSSASVSETPTQTNQ